MLNVILNTIRYGCNVLQLLSTMLYVILNTICQGYSVLQELCDDLVQYVCLGCTVLQLLSTIPYVQDVQYVVYYA